MSILLRLRFECLKINLNQSTKKKSDVKIIYILNLLVN